MLNEPKRVLVVDDDAELARGAQRTLMRAGWEVDIAENGREALEHLAKTEYSVVVTDLAMPEMDGIALLRAVRYVNLDVPVIVATAAPDVSSAAAAVELGAFRYFVKPVLPELLLSSVSRAARLHTWARLRRSTTLGQESSNIGDRAGVEESFKRALKTMWMAFQPVVTYRTKAVFAYEALMRTHEPTLPTPQAVLEAATRLSRHELVGQRVRRLVASALDATPGVTCFVNLHVKDLLDETLYQDNAPLSVHARRVVLELTERTPLDEISGLRARIARLREMGYRIAVDDLGAGYSGLATMAQLEPEVVKVDMSLVRHVDREPTKQRLVSALVSLCLDLDTRLVVEGVETAGERDQLLDLGCDFFQGYLFGRPEAGFGAPRW